jgi:hypothetical protein
VPVVCDGLKRHSTCREAVVEGLCALVHCCLPPHWELLRNVVSSGGVSVAVGAIQSFPNDSQVLHVACGALSNLCNRHIEPLRNSALRLTVRDQIFDLNCIQALVDASQSFKQRDALKDVAAYVARTLSRLLDLLSCDVVQLDIDRLRVGVLESIKTTLLVDVDAWLPSNLTVTHNRHVREGLEALEEALDTYINELRRMFGRT